MGDIGDSDLLEMALSGVTHVILAAGGLTPADSAAQPLEDVRASLEPLLAVLDALRDRPGTRLVYLSSGGTVYGNPERLPIAEEHPTNPITPYGITKLAGEKYVALYRELHGVPGLTLRCGNIYGEREQSDRNQGVVAVFLERISRGEPLVVYGDGAVVRDYLYARDLASAVVALLDAEVGVKPLNVGSGRGESLLALVRLMEDVTDLQARIVNVPSRGFDVRHVVLDISRLRSTIHFEPLTLRAGLERTWYALDSVDSVAASAAAVS